MTSIHLYRNGRGQLQGFSTIGHTGSAPQGEDIVCAGISALSITAVNALEAVAGVRASVHTGDGFLSVRLPRTMHKRQAARARIILRTACLGFENIAAAYPAHVRISQTNNQQEVQPCLQ